jgi:serine/threonine-protein kinase
MDNPSPPVSGLVAGKYEVLDLIGRGGMGSVWRGRHSSLGTMVAVKFVDPEYAQSREARSRFVTEARAAATIQSKHAVQIYDHGMTDDGRPYIVMELLVGEPLDKRIDRLRHISLQETARVLSQVCRALQRAHDAGIIHRDLKPENIFLVRSLDDDDEVAKVLDFGIAKIKAPPGEQPATSSTKTGAVLGTPYYMSPEQARGLRNIDHRTDLWSLGVIAYKCVTGILPFEGESVGDLLVKICTGPVPTPSLTVPGLPPSFDAWFSRALEREPERRFSRASELAEGLALAAGLSTRRGPTSSDEGLFAAPIESPNVREAVSFPGANATSAPITASSSPMRSSRGVVLGAVAAALIGGSIGVAAVVRFVSAPKAAAKEGATAVGAHDTGSTNTNAPATANASAAVPPSPSSTAAAITTGTPLPKTFPSAAAIHPTKPSASVTAVPAHAGFKPPTGPQPPPAPAASSVKPPATPNSGPTSADPGY